MSDIKDKAKLLEEEAAALIDFNILKLPVNTRSGASARIVECIVSAAVLRITEIVQASSQGKGDGQ
jgi:hypothetical protein